MGLPLLRGFLQATLHEPQLELPLRQTAIRGHPVNLVRQSNADLVLEIEYRVDEKPTAPVRLAMTCGTGCSGALDLTSVLDRATRGQWHTLKVRLADFKKAGTNMSEVIEPCALTTRGRLSITLMAVRLGTDTVDVATLPSAQP